MLVNVIRGIRRGGPAVPVHCQSAVIPVISHLNRPGAQQRDIDMTPALATRPTEDLTDPQSQAGRASLAELAALGAEEITARLHRVLPGAGSGQVPVAAFNSSI
ncbi:FxSxx-COOH cyclophane-containing RiPP peptide [Kitasatospora indigofera]|uniref:FxSxx-COOH cyclophane-containing RiPP peptide n=1 Tax=Kitasatospora indigofera TaxID=67307 RepID=UPI00364F8CB4